MMICSVSVVERFCWDCCRSRKESSNEPRLSSIDVLCEVVVVMVVVEMIFVREGKEEKKKARVDWKRVRSICEEMTTMERI